MTTKRKAEELAHSFNSIDAKNNLQYGMEWQMAKQCALIAVDEILNLNFNIKCDASERCVNPVMDYWREVKQEIEKL